MRLVFQENRNLGQTPSSQASRGLSVGRAFTGEWGLGCMASEEGVPGLGSMGRGSWE